MDKIKITAEVEKAFKEYTSVWEEKTANEIFKSFILERNSGAYYTTIFKPLNGISEQDFFFMLHGWYEVEKPKPKFEVGDWVYDTDLKRYRKVTKEALSSVEFVPLVGANSLPYFEKVTEEWKIVLLELGREKPELKVGDKFTTIRGDLWAINYTNITSLDCSKIKFKYFYPVESRIEFKQ